MSTAPIRHRFTAEEYFAMGDGVLDPDIRTELLDGEVLELSPIGSPHASIVARMDRVLQRLYGDSALLWVQGPMLLSKWSVPQPDLLVLAPRDDFYAEGGPGPADSLLLVEVSDSTLSFDRNRKLSLYAEAGVCDVWIVDVARRRILQFTDPAESRYSSQSVAERGGTVALPGTTHEVAVQDLIG